MVCYQNRWSLCWNVLGMFYDSLSKKEKHRHFYQDFKHSVNHKLEFYGSNLWDAIQGKLALFPFCVFLIHLLYPRSYQQKRKRTAKFTCFVIETKTLLQEINDTTCAPFGVGMCAQSNEFIVWVEALPTMT